MAMKQMNANELTIMDHFSFFVIGAMSLHHPHVTYIIYRKNRRGNEKINEKKQEVSPALLSRASTSRRKDVRHEVLAFAL